MLLSGFLQLQRLEFLCRSAGGFSLPSLLLLGRVGPRAQGLQWVWHTGQLLHSTGDLPGPGRKPTSSVWAGRFLTPGPPGTSWILLFLNRDVGSTVTVSLSLAPVPATVSPSPHLPYPPPLRCPPLQGCSRDAEFESGGLDYTGDRAGGVQPRFTVDAPLTRSLTGLGPCRPRPHDFLPRDPGHDVHAGDVQHLGGTHTPLASPRAHQEHAHRAMGFMESFIYVGFIYFILMGFSVAVLIFN